MQEKVGDSVTQITWEGLQSILVTKRGEQCDPNHVGRDIEHLGKFYFLYWSSKGGPFFKQITKPCH